MSINNYTRQPAAAPPSKVGPCTNHYHTRALHEHKELSGNSLHGKKATLNTHQMKTSPLPKLFPGMLDTNTKVHLGWPSISGLNRVRRKLGSRMRSGASPASNLSKLQTSFDPLDTIRSLRAHKWSIYDAQYLFLAVVGIFCLSVMEEPGALVRTSIATLLMISLLMPITRQFFLPFLPIASWLVLFWTCRYVIIIA